MGTVHRLPTARPQRDRLLDATLVPGAVVEHPDSVWGPPCLARLVARNVPDANGHVDASGVHDWYVLSCGEDPDCVGTVASFPTIVGARFVRFDTPAQRVAAGEVRRG